MNEITITWNDQIILIDGDKHDFAVVLERCRKQIFPGIEPPAFDPVFERILKGRTMKGKK
jgi:hypothetical protein